MPVQSSWSGRIIWGNHMLSGGYLNPRGNAWSTEVVWGAHSVHAAQGGDNIVWGTACGDCVEACPKTLFVLLPAEDRMLVQCRNLVSGDEALEQCKVACTACGKCVQDAAPGLISVASGVAVVNHERISEATERAVARCPTGAIVWLTGAQFRQPASHGVKEAA